MSSSGPSSIPHSIDLTYRFTPSNPKPFFVPQDWMEASLFLQGGNEALGRYFDACRRGRFEEGETPPVIEFSALEAMGEPRTEDGLPVHYPYAAVVGCSDARVPTEVLFGQEFNDIFNIRVAGNVVTQGGTGSLIYALRTFVHDDPIRPRSLKLVVALGHRGCGAVRAAVSAYQASGGSTDYLSADDPLEGLLKKITDFPLKISANAFDTLLGPGSSRNPAYAASMAELTVYMNAAWTGYQLRGIVESMGPEISERVGVVYGIFDPGDLRVHSRPMTFLDPEGGMLAEPPRDLAEMEAMALIVARGLWPDHPLLA